MGLDYSIEIQMIFKTIFMLREKRFLNRCIAIAVFAMLFSCSDDLVPVEQDKKELKFEWNTKTFDELKNNQKFSKSYNQVTEKISEKRNSVNGRTVMEDSYNFTIDSTSIYEVVAEGYTSYTFSIFRENQPNINYTYYENLFIEIDSTDIPQASILKFNLSSDHSVTSIESNKIIYNNDTADKILYNGGGGDGCTTVSIYYVETCGCPGQHWPEDPSCTCYSSPPTSTFLNSYTTCPSSGPGGTTTTGILTFHPGGSTSTTSLSVSNPYSYVSQRRKSLKQNFPAGLTFGSPVYNWLMQPNGSSELNESIQGAIFNYLESQVNFDGLLSTSTVYPQEAVAFVFQLINHCIINNLNPQDALEHVVASIIEEQIDDSSLTPCAKNILNSIRNSLNNDVVAIIKQLDDPNKVYKTKIISANLGPVSYILGSTNWTGFISGGSEYTPYDYTIKLNQNLIIQGTDLKIYSTILHEIIHAYFLSLIDDCHQANNCTLLQTFPEVWNYYVQNQGADNISQHNQFALNYVNVIAQALEEFHPGLPSQYYLDLAWGGLHETIPYQNNDPATRQLTSDDRERINKINKAEASNTPQYNPSGVLTYFPLGTPCN